MNRFTNKVVVIPGGSSGIGLAAPRELMTSLIRLLIKSGVLKEDLDYHLMWFCLLHQSICLSRM